MRLAWSDGSVVVREPAGKRRARLPRMPPGFAMDVLEGGAIAFALAVVFVVLAIVAPLIGVVVDLILAILLTTLGLAGRL